MEVNDRKSAGDKQQQALRVSPSDCEVTNGLYNWTIFIDY